GRNEFRKGARTFAPITRFRIMTKLKTKPILGMKRRRRNNDFHFQHRCCEVGDAERQPKKNGLHFEPHRIAYLNGPVNAKPNDAPTRDTQKSNQATNKGMAGLLERS